MCLKGFLGDVFQEFIGFWRVSFGSCRASLSVDLGFCTAFKAFETFGFHRLRFNEA